jgi:alpha-L-fucosidase 2
MLKSTGKYGLLCSLVLIVHLGFYGSGKAQTKSTLPSPNKGFVSTQAATLWEKALLSGNGKYGALVFGQPLDETIILSHARLCMPLNKPLPPPNTAPYLGDIRKLLEGEQYQKAADLVVENSKKEGYDFKRWTDPPIPAFNIKIVMTPDGEIRNYQRSVDFSTGVASVNWSDNRGNFERNLFVSQADDVIVLTLKSGSTGKITCALQLVQQSPVNAGGWNSEGMCKEGIKSYKTSAEGNWLTYRSEFTRQWEGSLQGYDGVSKIVVRGGETVTDGDQIKIKGADEVLVLTRINMSYDFDTPQIEKLQKEISVVSPDFNALLARHAKIHGGIFNRVNMDLGGDADRNLSSEELIQKSTFGNLNPALLEKVFDAGRYNILSGSGELFPYLQGLWTGTYGPPWSGSYTLNGNVQTAIAADMSANMAECILPFFRFIEDHIDELRLNAKQLFGCRGICFPSVASTHLLNNHFDANWCMTFWTAGAGWASYFFYDYYEYTGDKEFLSTRAYPFMKEAALFYEDFLTKGKDGKYIFSPSYSPENNPSNSKAQASVNAAMDIGVARQLLNNCISAATILKTDADKVKLWKKMLANMPDYLVNEKGALKEWVTPLLADNESHRHCSHLYALYYGIPDEMATNTKLLNAFDEALKVKINLRRREFKGESVNGRPPGEMAFGLVLQGFVAASLRKADVCAELVDWLSNKYWNPNFASLHNPGNIFNTDISGGLPALVLRMLVDSKPGSIDFLPAWPNSMPPGKVEGAALRGQIILKELIWNGKNITAILNSKTTQKVKISVPGEIRSINGKSTSKDCTVKLIENQDLKLDITLK